MTNLLLLAIAVAVVVWSGWTFNRLVRLRTRAQGSWSDIDVQLKRRHDLVENLVQTVKGYVQHEKSTLEQVVRLRSQAEGARESGDPGEAGAAEARLATQVQRLLAVVEAYPDLKASDRFRDLQRALTEVEDDLQNARRYYNAVVRDLNTRIQSFPDLVIARMMGLAERAFFELDDPDEARAPEIRMETR